MFSSLHKLQRSFRISHWSYKRTFPSPYFVSRPWSTVANSRTVSVPSPANWLLGCIVVASVWASGSLLFTVLQMHLCSLLWCTVLSERNELHELTLWLWSLGVYKLVSQSVSVCPPVCKLVFDCIKTSYSELNIGSCRPSSSYFT
jgi:hypothetical protein